MRTRLDVRSVLPAGRSSQLARSSAPHAAGGATASVLQRAKCLHRGAAQGPPWWNVTMTSAPAQHRGPSRGVVPAASSTDIASTLGLDSADAARMGATNALSVPLEPATGQGRKHGTSSDESFDRWFRYPAGFASDYVRVLLDRLELPAGATVLDCFAGSGVTGTAARGQGMFRWKRSCLRCSPAGCR